MGGCVQAIAYNKKRCIRYFTTVANVDFALIREGINPVNHNLCYVCVLRVFFFYFNDIQSVSGYEATGNNKRELGDGGRNP